MTHPKITAFQSIMLFSDGAPLTPVGGSSWSLGETRKRKYGVRGGKKEGYKNGGKKGAKRNSGESKIDKLALKDNEDDIKMLVVMNRTDDRVRGGGRVREFKLTLWMQDDYQSKHDLLYQHDFSRQPGCAASTAHFPSCCRMPGIIQQPTIIIIVV